MDNNDAPKLSPLSQAVTREGKSVQVEIFEDGQGQWILEVVDAWNNSFVWDDTFPTDQAALDEALATIDDEGIDALIGKPRNA